MKYEAIICDLDGTLLNTLEDISDSANVVLRKHGFPTFDQDAYRTFVGAGVRALVNHIIPVEHRNDRTINICLEDFRQIYAKNYDSKTKLYDGITQMLDGLTSRGIKISIFSNKPDDLTRECVGTYMANWNFEMVVGHHPGIPHKPDPSGALLIAKSIKIDPEYILFLGDTSIDMKTAVRAKMFPVGAIWGFRTKKELLKSGALEVIEQPQDLLLLVDRM